MLMEHIKEFLAVGGIFCLAAILWRGMTPRWWRSDKFVEHITNAKFFFFDAILVLPVVSAIAFGISALVPSAIDVERYDLPWAAEFLIAVFFSDLAGYWRHRVLHMPAFWLSHAVHHSDRHVHWLTLVRIHPVERVFSVVFDSVMLSIIGVGPEFVAANGLLRHYYGYLEHADLGFTLGKLRYVFVTPHFHRWHHAMEERAHGKNFAVIFSFIDLAFGTFYCPNERPSQCGVEDIPARQGFAQLLVLPFTKWRLSFAADGSANTRGAGSSTPEGR
jgi:sterol desaturase/sphingolipid hydroxylase (fatty acid hydroxylase superfamily)